jgi:hypothetical protein
MKDPDDLIVSAALYFDPTTADAVPVGWLDGSLELLNLNRVPVHHFETIGAASLDETQIHQGPTDIARLRAALAANPVEVVGLWCRESDTDLAIRRQAVAEINSRYGYAFLGMPIEAGLYMKDILLATHRLTGMVAPPRYGIAYLRRGRFSPLGYAEGFSAPSTHEFPAPEDLPTRDRIGRWHTEMVLARRYPFEKFRSVYPVQLLSEAHRAARLDTGRPVADIGLGTWTQLEDGMWLWDLTEGELPFARDALERSGLLIAA